MATSQAVVLMFVRRAGVRDVYGGEKSMVATAANLRSFRPIAMTTAEDALIGELERGGIEHDVVPVGDPFDALRAGGLAGLARRLLALGRVNWAVYKRLRRERGFIVHASELPGFFSSWLGAKAAGAKVIHHIRCATRRDRARWFEQLAMLLADRTLTVSKGLRDQWLDRASPWVRRRTQERTQVVRNGFRFDEIDRFVAALSGDDCRAEVGTASDQFVVLVVGAIFRDKGQLPFLERGASGILTAIPSARIVFVGGVKDTEYDRRCKEVVRKRGWTDRVQFTGYLDQARVFAWYRAADILVLPSEVEGLPRCAVEAQAFGLPVVCTDAVGSSEAIIDGESGLLVPAADMERVGQGVVRLARDPALRRRFGERGAEQVRDRLDIRRNVEAIEAIYRQLTTKSNGVEP